MCEPVTMMSSFLSDGFACDASEAGGSVAISPAAWAKAVLENSSPPRTELAISARRTPAERTNLMRNPPVADECVQLPRRLPGGATRDSRHVVGVEAPVPGADAGAIVR